MIETLKDLFALSGANFCVGVLSGMYDNRMENTFSLSSGLIMGGTSLYNIYFGACTGANISLEKNNIDPSKDLTDFIKGQTKIKKNQIRYL